MDLIRKINESQRVYTFHKANFTCFVIGMAITWLATGSLWALIGTFIASLHFVWVIPQGLIDELREQGLL